MREFGDPSAVGAPARVLPWLDAAGPSPALRLFCFAHAGGGAAAFRPWVTGERRTPVRVCPVRAPGRESRWEEPRLDRVADLAEDFLRAAAPLLSTPFALLGNSLGSLVAFEVARRLSDRGRPAPVHLLVGASPPPGVEARRIRLSGLSDAEFTGELQRRYGGIPDVILHDPDLLREYLPTLRSDVAAVESYRPPPQPPLGCPVTALVGVDDASVPADEVDGWREWTSGPFARHLLPGGHFTVLDHRDLVLDLLGSVRVR
ncbi:thioesterase II family protein [Micromonospora mirobrigensis]|uniref:thioesterase II family protein n=1 Tax=Micromonospora mirobrigensis TaxID=262898 RepID=UPI00159EFDCF|nr:thioesterase [Micromonospora mirobrigensis]